MTLHYQWNGSGYSYYREDGTYASQKEINEYLEKNTRTRTIADIEETITCPMCGRTAYFTHEDSNGFQYKCCTTFYLSKTYVEA